MRRFTRWMAGLGAVAVAAQSTFAQAPRQPQAAPPRAAAPAQAQAPAAEPAADPAAEALQRRQMEQLLGLWEKQSARLKTLDVGFTRFDKSPAWNENIEYRGRAYFQAPNLACLHFQRVEDAPAPDPAKAALPAAKPKLLDHERIICSGNEVFQYDYNTKQIFIFPLEKDQRKRALDQGPLPFLFNMKAEEAKQRYQMQLIKQSNDAYLIGVLPLLKEDQSVFSKAFLQLNKKTFLPDRLVLISPNGKDTQDYVFNGVSPNGQINPGFFKGTKIAGWKEVYNPAPNQNGPQQPGRNPRQPAIGRDAMPAPRR